MAVRLAQKYWPVATPPVVLTVKPAEPESDDAEPLVPITMVAVEDRASEARA
jgi:hypothetical protein